MEITKRLPDSIPAPRPKKKGSPNPLWVIVVVVILIIVVALALAFLFWDERNGPDDVEKFLTAASRQLSQPESELPRPPKGVAMRQLTPVLRDVQSLRTRLGTTTFSQAMKERAPSTPESPAMERLSRVLSDPDLRSLQLVTVELAGFRPELNEGKAITCEGREPFCSRISSSRLRVDREGIQGIRRIVADLAVDPGEPNASVLMVDRGNSIVGSIFVGAQSFVVNQLTGRLFAVTTRRHRENDRDMNDVYDSRVPPGSMPVLGSVAPKAPAAPTDTVFPSGLAKCPNPPNLQVVEIVVGVTKRAQAQSLAVWKDMDALIDIALSTANTSFENSEISARVSMLSVIPLEYVEAAPTEKFKEDIAELLKPGGKLEPLRRERANRRADVAILVADHPEDNVCGKASGHRVQKGMAYAVVNWKCLADNFSFIHEIGHLVGAWHDPKSIPKEEVVDPPYAHGYITTGQRPVATIMANRMSCSSNCGRGMAWSNPDKRTRDGQVLGTLDQNFDACIWRERLREVAAFDGG